MTTQQPLLLQVHPDDYERLEAAAELLGYSMEDVAKLFIHREVSSLLADFDNRRPHETFNSCCTPSLRHSIARRAP